MPDIIVSKPFTLTLSHDYGRFYAAGLHKDVDKEVAEHWYTKAHLAKDNEELVANPAAPLTHEERVAVKGSLDAAEARARAAQDERDNIKQGLEKLTVENATLKARVAELEEELDAATKPARQALSLPPKPIKP